MRPPASLTRALRSAVMRPRATMHARFASTLLKMPAMSPTMTEGGIAGWKVKEGDSFAAGDVILEIETDKATIDVEASDDGVMGKIIIPAGAKGVPVGKPIAVIAEEGDDLSKLEVPKDTADAAVPKADDAAPAPAAAAAASTPAPAEHHAAVDSDRAMFPSVRNLLATSGLSSDQVEKIKGTGLHGILTRGDVLAAMGKITNPYGSAEKLLTTPVGPSGKPAGEQSASSSSSSSSSKSAAAGEDEANKPAAARKPEAPLDGPSLRRTIALGLGKAATPLAPFEDPVAAQRSQDEDFDDLLSDYMPTASKKASKQVKQQEEAQKELAMAKGEFGFGATSALPGLDDTFSGMWKD